MSSPLAGGDHHSVEDNYSPPPHPFAQKIIESHRAEFFSQHHVTHGPRHALRVYDDIEQLLSDEHNPTPLVKLRGTPFQHTEVYGKIEWYNPYGSIKDRVASNMVGYETDVGRIDEKQHLVEPTSGNTGLALAMVANRRNLPLTVPISLKVPLEKRNALKFFGADVIELEDDL